MDDRMLAAWFWDYTPKKSGGFFYRHACSSHRKLAAHRNRAANRYTGSRVGTSSDSSNRYDEGRSAIRVPGGI